MRLMRIAIVVVGLFALCIDLGSDNDAMTTPARHARSMRTVGSEQGLFAAARLLRPDAVESADLFAVIGDDTDRLRRTTAHDDADDRLERRPRPRAGRPR